LARQARRRALADKDFAGDYRSGHVDTTGFIQNPCLFFFSRRAWNPVPAKMRAVWWRSKARRKPSTIFWTSQAAEHRIRQESTDEKLFNVIFGFEALTRRARQIVSE
jgi:hypothetical protein